MHFCYIDEAGCTGCDLGNEQQPVFVSGGIVVRDEGWNRTKEDFYALMAAYFNGAMPNAFELHSHELLSPTGAGCFSGHDRERRISLAHSVLDLVSARRHNVMYVAIDKAKMGELGDVELRTKLYITRKDPYTIAYDYLISCYEWFIKERLGRSARGMAIVDTKDIFEGDILEILQYRRANAPAAQKVKWLTEFTYAIDSQKNPMVQISDLVCYVTKKFIEIDSGYKDNWPRDAKIVYRDLFAKIHARSVRKTALLESGRNSEQYNDFMAQIVRWPSRGFEKKEFA